MIEITDIKQTKTYTVKCRGCLVLVSYNMLGGYSALNFFDEETIFIEEIKEMFDSEQLIIGVINRRINNHKLRMQRKFKKSTT
jgi:hypothetical protein